MRKLRPEPISLPKAADKVNDAEELIPFLTQNLPIFQLPPNFHLFQRVFLTHIREELPEGIRRGLGKSIADTTCDYCVWCFPWPFSSSQYRLYMPNTKRVEESCQEWAEESEDPISDKLETLRTGKNHESSTLSHKYTDGREWVYERTVTCTCSPSQLWQIGGQTLACWYTPKWPCENNLRHRTLK